MGRQWHGETMAWGDNGMGAADQGWTWMEGIEQCGGQPERLTPSDWAARAVLQWAR